MIVNWKRTSATEFVARWQNQRLVLRYEEHKWRLYVDERRVKQFWASEAAAKKHIDRVQQHLIVEAMALCPEARPHVQKVAHA